METTGVNAMNTRALQLDPENASATTDERAGKQQSQSRGEESRSKATSGATGQSGRSGETKEVVKQESNRVVKEGMSIIRQKGQSLAESGKSKVITSVSAYGKALRSAADALKEKDASGAGQYADTIANQLDSVVNYLENAPVDKIVSEAERFVKKNAAVAFTGAFAVGLVASRLARAGTSALSESDAQK